MHNYNQITSGGFAHGDPALLVGAMIGVEDRARERIEEYCHRLLESNAMLCSIGRCFGGVPVELDPHSLQLAPERAMLQRGEQPAELGKMGAAVGFKHIDLGHAPGKRWLKVERRRNFQRELMGWRGGRRPY